MGKDKMTPAEVLELNELMRRIEAIDLGKLEEEKRDALTDVERMVADLSENKVVRRVIAGKSDRTPRGKNHWKQRRKRARMYARERGNELRRRKLAESLKTPEGWWEHIMKPWRTRAKVYLTYEQFLEHIYPWIEKGHVVTFRRINSLRGLSLDNLVVRDTRGELLFDGSEWKLRKMGYIL